MFVPVLENKGIKTDFDYIQKVISLIKKRANFISDFWNLSNFFFVAPINYDQTAQKNWTEQTPTIMNKVISILESIDDFLANNIETILKNWLNQNQIPIGKVMQPLRISLVGAMKGPDLFEIMQTIGKQETLQRIQKAIETL